MSDQHTEEEKELMREEDSRLDAIAAVVIILSLTAAAYFCIKPIIYLGETKMDVVNFLKDKTRIPVIGAPLFTVSYPELVLAQCKAGVVGSFPALNARPEEID